MVNVVVIEGYVTNDVWEFGGDTLFRLAHVNGAGENEYFTVRLRSSLPVRVPPPGSRVIVTARAVDRQEDFTLEDHVRRAARGREVDRGLVERLGRMLDAERRSYTEFLAQAVSVVSGPK